jgi:hypothetical protein
MMSSSSGVSVGTISVEALGWKVSSAILLRLRRGADVLSVSLSVARCLRRGLRVVDRSVRSVPGGSGLCDLDINAMSSVSQLS